MGPVTWPPDATLLRQGEIPSTVYVIDDGAVGLRHLDRSGNEYVIDIVRSPALVGDAFAIAQRPCIVEAITISSCTLRWCTAEAFIEAISSSPDKTRRSTETHRWHCSVIIELLERAVAMSVKSSSARLDYFIGRYRRPVAEQGRDLPFKQSLIASFLNITPEHLSRLIKQKAAKTEAETARPKGGPGPIPGRQRSR